MPAGLTYEEGEGLNVFERDTRTLGHSKKGILGDVELDADFVGQTFVKTAKHSTATCEEDAVHHNIGVEFRRSFVKCLKHGSLYARDGFLDAMGDFLIADRYFHGESSHLVGPVDDEVFRGIFKLGECRADMDFDLLGCTFANLNVMDTAHVFHNVVCEVVACNLNALVGHDASKRDYGNLGSTTTYVQSCCPGERARRCRYRGRQP